MIDSSIGVFGATSLVGESLVNILQKKKKKCIAFSRSVAKTDFCYREGSVCWFAPDKLSEPFLQKSISKLISLTPIWVLHEHFPLLESLGVRRIVVLSSTSIVTKEGAHDPYDFDIACRLKEGESRLIRWAEGHGVEWTILRPTLIYGAGRDKNISSIAKFINKFRIFPLCGDAKGLRQPIHREDVAQACLAALDSSIAVNSVYNISGAEILTYRCMVERVFDALEKKPKFIQIPLSLFDVIIPAAYAIPAFRGVTKGMVERMGQDMVFDHRQASQDFSFSPRAFILKKEDVM